MKSFDIDGQAKIILDLGCGKNKRVDAIGVDFSDRFQADIMHDLNVFPYPFTDSSVDEVYLDNVLEHLSNPIGVMEEVYRISKKGANIKVIVPYFRSSYAFIDPTHKTFYSVDSFSYYDPRHYMFERYGYTYARFLVVKILFNESLNNKFLKKILIYYANKYPKHYEIYLSHLFPLDDLTFYLIKD